MKRKTYFLVIFLAIILIIIGYGMQYYYAPPKEREPYAIEKNNDDTIRVAYIGDSWAFFHKPYDQRISDSLTIRLNRPAKVTSIGFCGRSSKEVYWYLFDNPELVSFISKGYNYCIISLGINDANKKMSTNYYKQSMAYIIQFMLANQITPIILEIPDYDIEKMYRWEIPSRKLLRSFSRFITGIPINCKTEFRQALDALLTEKKYGDRVQVIRYQTWNNHYAEDLKNLYKGDGIHLNEKGYERLDSCIVDIFGKGYYENLVGRAWSYGYET